MSLAQNNRAGGASILIVLIIRYVTPVLAQNTTATSSQIPTGILPISYRSGGITFPDWISLLTLCFIPLLAHVIAGVPSTVYLSRRRPAWHERICHFNPTSVLWRYFIILDRRVRSRVWTAADMAGSNALFWTTKGWNGSEVVMRESRRLLTRTPRERHAAILSGSFAKTGPKS